MSRVFLQKYGSSLVAFIKIHRQWLPISLFIISVVITNDAAWGSWESLWLQAWKLNALPRSANFGYSAEHPQDGAAAWPERSALGIPRLVQPLTRLSRATLKLLPVVSGNKVFFCPRRCVKTAIRPRHAAPAPCGCTAVHCTWGMPLALSWLWTGWAEVPNDLRVLSRDRFPRAIYRSSAFFTYFLQMGKRKASRAFLISWKL